jgi:hypothetical protein
MPKRILKGGVGDDGRSCTIQPGWRLDQVDHVIVSARRDFDILLWRQTRRYVCYDSRVLL